MTPRTDWVNSTPGKYCIKGEFGPNTPNKRAPLASGGRTRGRITITLITNVPRNPLYLARKYASGIPNRARSEVEIVAETRLRTKAFQRLWSCQRFEYFYRLDKSYYRNKWEYYICCYCRQDY